MREDDAATVNRVRALLEAASGSANEVLDLRTANGAWHLWLSGSDNHVGRVEVLDRYSAIAATAPGSFGVPYVHDDEHPDRETADRFEAHVMRRGTVSVERDEHLSPLIPMIEDDGSEQRPAGGT